MQSAKFIGATAVIGLVACVDPPTASLPDGGSVRDLAPSAVIVARASGGGCYDLSSAGLAPGCVELNAVRYSDNTSAGQFRMRRPGSGGVVGFAGKVTCFVVDAANSRAWIGAVVTENFSTDPAALTPINQVGKDVWFRIVDYAGAEPIAADRTTVLGFEGAAGFITSLQYCDGRPWPAGDARTFPLLSGNFSVTP
jgi:hypothetical protein